ncbi:methyltransferase [Spirosoma harenae]
MFTFKQFVIHQDRTAMKVCTDACVLGAYADLGVGGSILDIGTGTGLLALMAAQRNSTARIDAIEMDEAAYQQAAENVGSSPFSERVNVVHSRIQDFVGQNGYDRILTNPPFYTNHLRSPDAAVNRALHTDELPFADLVNTVTRFLKPDGEWWVLLPPYESGKLVELAQAESLFPFKQLSVRHHAKKPVFRMITAFSFDRQAVNEEVLDIYEVNGQSTYTPEFQSLLRDFYLIF